MKVLVTGAGGGLGSELPELWPEVGLIQQTRGDLDITDAAAVQSRIEEKRPDVIIHAAAYTAVDRAESEPEKAMAANRDGTANVAKAAAAIDAVLIYPSTDYVFDGKKETPYREDDQTNPLSVYGKSKLAGEQVAIEHNPKTYVVRTSWLYAHHGKSFVSTMLKLFKEKNELSIVSDEVSSPTYAKDFAEALKALLDARPDFGIYHASCGGETNWFEFAQEIAGLSNDDVRLKPTTASAWGAAAKRPAYSKLDCGKIGGLGIKLPDWKVSLQQFFADW